MNHQSCPTYIARARNRSPWLFLIAGIVLILALALLTGCAWMKPKPSADQVTFAHLQELDATADAAEQGWASSWKTRMRDAVARKDVTDQFTLGIEQKAADRTVRNYQDAHREAEVLLSAKAGSTNGPPLMIPAALLNAHFSLTNTLHLYGK